MAYAISEGQPYPLGSSIVDDGVNFAVFSEFAESIELCLFDASGDHEIQRIPLKKSENYVWCIRIKALNAGAKYGFRAHGKFDPECGLYFNSSKILIDPYARELDRPFAWSDEVYAHKVGVALDDLHMCDLDNVRSIPKSVVCQTKSEAEISQIQAGKPEIPWKDTIIYEAHVCGLTKLNTQIPVEARGTFAGLAHENTILYLKKLGVTAIELLPVHSFIDEAFISKLGLSNYWGYNTLSFFSPHTAYLCAGQANEFLSMVETLHREGIEVILDVVYNHTAESNAAGPSLSFRGLDNPNYYRLDPKTHEFINDTGCGNTVQADHPRVLQLILDSLRYWASEMGVDGFRFDLASILGRTPEGFRSRSAFFQAISQDPILSKCKLIAEPWDIGPGGYQLGAFPGEWSEWNDRFRDTCRKFWRGDKGLLPEFAKRIHGSSDLFEHNGRGARATINFITSHDGFTLADLVSYKQRHNEANKENNADGHHANFSDNYGVEGQTEDPDIVSLRLRQQRNLIATLFLSQGTPMLLAGDERGKSQYGNNNAYCQNNEITWLDWSDVSADKMALLDFTRKVISLRKQLFNFFPEKFIHDNDDSEAMLRAEWLNRHGSPMQEKDWHDEQSSFLAWMLTRNQIENSGSVIFLFNANTGDVVFELPKADVGARWRILLDTSLDAEDGGTLYCETSEIKMGSRSVMVLSNGS